MSIIGNIILVNQLTPTVIKLLGNQYARFDFQNIVAQIAVQEKVKEIEEVRPTEEIHSIYSDRENSKEKFHEEKDNSDIEKKSISHKKSSENHSFYHLLDIKV